MAFGIGLDVFPAPGTADGRENGNDHDAIERVLYTLGPSGLFELAKLALALLLNCFYINPRLGLVTGSLPFA